MQNPEKIIESLERITTANEEMLRSVESLSSRLDSALRPTVSALEDVNNSMNQGSNLAENLKKGFMGLYKSVATIIGALKILEFVEKRRNKKLSKKGKNQDLITQSTNQTATAQKNATTATATHQKATEGARKSTGQYLNTLDKLRKSLTKVTTAFGKNTKAATANADSINKATTASSKKMAQKIKTTKAINDQNIALAKSNDLASKNATLTGKAATAGAVKAGVTTAQTIGTKKLTFAQKALNKAMMVGPFALKMIAMMAIMRLIGPLINGIGNLIGMFTRSGREARRQAREMERLADAYGVTTEKIESDIERMGDALDGMEKTATEVWATVNSAAQEAAARFGGYADTIRGEIADLVYYYGDYEQAIASWEASHMEAIAEAAAQWGVYAGDVKDALGEISLDEWVAIQEEQLGELANAWNMSSEDIQAALYEQGISMSEWEQQQEESLHALSAEWGISIDDIIGEMNKHGISLDEWTASQQQAWADLQGDIRNQTGKIINNFREIPKEYEKSAEELIRIMYNNRQRYNQWRENMATITERFCDEIGPEMIAFIESQGPEFNSVIEEMLNCTDTLEAFQEEFRQTADDATRHVIDGMDCPEARDAAVQMLENAGQQVRDSTYIIDAYDEVMTDAAERAVEIAETGGLETGQAFVEAVTRVDYTVVGRDIMAGLNRGLLAGEGNVMATAARIANNIANTMRAALDINSPSRLMREQIGRQIPAGVAAGIDKYSDYALDSVYDLGKDLLKVKIPKMSDIINMGPSLSYAGAGGAYGGNVTNVDRTNDNRGLFEGATINWHGKQDIRETMEEIAWEIQSQDARFI